MCWQLRNQIVQDIVLPTFISSLESVSYLVESVLQNVRLGDDEGLRTAVEHGTLQVKNAEVSVSEDRSR